MAINNNTAHFAAIIKCEVPKNAFIKIFKLVPASLQKQKNVKKLGLSCCSSSRVSRSLQSFSATTVPKTRFWTVFSSFSEMEAESHDQEQQQGQQRQEGGSVKWSGGVELTLSCPVESAWAVQSDFLGLVKWAHNVFTCECVEGNNKEVGCLRHCIGSGSTWVYERLMQFDDRNMCMSYRMEKNQFVFPHGFQGYYSTVQLRDGGEGKTIVSWTYNVDPVFNQTKEELTTFMTGFYTIYLKCLEIAANSNLMTSSKTTTTTTTTQETVGTGTPSLNPVQENATTAPPTTATTTS